MPTQDFFPFATDGDANVLSQSDYAALAAVATGFGGGGATVANSAQFNKAIRQGSIGTATLARLIGAALAIDVLDDGTTKEADLKLAIQKFVTDYNYAPLASPTLTGAPKSVTPTGTSNDTSIATTAFAQALLALKSPIASPTFSGIPAASTAARGTNTTQLSTTAYVMDALSQYYTAAQIVAAYYTAAQINAILGNYYTAAQIVASYYTAASVESRLASFAPLASPGLTGAPTCPTQGNGDNSGRIANTAWVQNQFVGSAAGYQLFPSGIILQWGITSSIPASSGASFNFPIGFPHNVLSVTACYTNGTAVGQAIEGNPFNVYLNDVRFSIFNGGTSLAQYAWHAIGY
jgi:hypothetical protein